VSHETIRNWEQGKRCPKGVAKALLKILDKAPEAALAEPYSIMFTDEQSTQYFKKKKNINLY
jgi:hypothetical protein